MDASVTPVSRLPEVGVSVFAVMTRLANEHGAINLSQGFPDFDCAPELIALVRDCLGRQQNQYAPMAGVPALKHDPHSRFKIFDVIIRDHPGPPARIVNLLVAEVHTLLILSQVLVEGAVIGSHDLTRLEADRSPATVWRS